MEIKLFSWQRRNNSVETGPNTRIPILTNTSIDFLIEKTLEQLNFLATQPLGEEASHEEQQEYRKQDRFWLDTLAMLEEARDCRTC